MTTKRRRAARAALRHLPRILITDTWQVMWAVSMIGMGLVTGFGVVTGDTGAMGRALYSLALMILWASAFLIGGVVQLVAIQIEARRLERLGMNLCGLGCTVYALTLFSIGSPQATAFGLVFSLIAVGYFVRILISNLSRAVSRWEVEL